MKEISNQILKPQQTKQLRQRLKLSKLHLCLLTLLFFIFNQVRLAQAELPKKTNFKCGVVSGITGPLSVVGTAIKNGVVLGVKEHDHNQRVKLIIEDDQFLPKNTVSAVNKLINSDNVDCLIIFGSSTALSVINTTEQKKIPLIAIALAEDVSKNREYSYRMYTSIPKITEVMSAEITRRGYKSIAIISTIQDATLSTTQALKSIAKTKIVLEQEMNIGDIDFRSIALKIKALNPDAVFFSMLPPQPSNLARQLRSLNYKGEF
ncbi:MAG: ABC transporter substrate-binding protein, partial [Proteobacteria bacterium]|nr:ABC transporter substrate-binding protein [Pseudomonadota bacterium]